MRLTVICHGKRTPRTKLDWLRRTIWDRHASRMDVDRLRVPDRLLKHVEPDFLDKVEDMFHSDRYENSLAEAIEPGLHPSEAAAFESARRMKIDSFLPKDLRSHPNEPKVLLYSDQQRFTKGLDQVNLLTNTSIFPHPPSPLANLIASIQGAITDQSELRLALERATLHAHLWQTDECKLPRRFQPSLPAWNHKTEYGIHPRDITRYLFLDLVRLIESRWTGIAEKLNIPCNWRSTNLPQYWTGFDRLIETYFRWNNQRSVHFRQTSDVVVSAKMPQRLFVPQLDEIKSLSRSTPPPWSSLGPMSPLIDLTSTNYYLDEKDQSNFAPKSTAFVHPHILTVNMSLPNVWSDFLEPEADPIRPDQRQAAGVMHCFAATVAHARQHSLVDQSSNQLVRPISVNGICSDGVYFDLISFQLNTLDLPDKTASATAGVRNLAWVDGNHRLFDKRIPRRSMLRNTIYRDLDTSLFSRLMAAYMWGCVEPGSN